MKDPYNPPASSEPAYTPEPPYYGRQAQDAYWDEQDNLAKLRLEVEQDLDRFKHELKHDKIKVIYDKDKNISTEVYVACEDKERTLNDYGVEQVMTFVSPLVRKMVVLGYWDEIDEINKRLEMLSVIIPDLFKNNFYQWGLDNENKISQIPAICFQIHQLIDSSYRRAYRGHEAKNLAPVWNINENVGGGYGPQSSSPSPIKRFNFFGGGGKWKKGY